MLHSFKFRKPVKNDAKNIVNLIVKGGVLDLNSEYLYLLQTTHFQDSCCVIEFKNEIIGFVSGYYLPQDKRTLFIWQVAVDKRFRGKNLASLMIRDIIERADIDYLISTVSPSNIASKRVFEKIAEDFNSELETKILFSKDDFLDSHEDEILFTIKKEKL